MIKNIYYNFNKNCVIWVYNCIEILFCIFIVILNYMLKINMNNFYNEVFVFKLIEFVCVFEFIEIDECK